MEDHIEINVGEKAKVKISFLFNLNIIYCGMPGKDVFSISCMESTGNHGFGMNLFFQKNQKQIRIRDYEFRVLEVTPVRILLQRLTTVSS